MKKSDNPFTFKETQGMTGINTFKNESFTMNYYQFGTGKRNMIIIPGVSMDPVMNVAQIVEMSYSVFAEDFTVYLFDRRDGIDSEISVRDMTDDIACVMKNIGISDAYIFGASQGGMISLSLAAYYPELVHLIYLGCTLPRQNDISRDTFKTWMELAKGDDVKALNHDIFRRIYSKEYYEKYAKVFADLESKGTKEQMIRFYYLAKACYDFDIYEDLDRIKCIAYLTGSKMDNAIGFIGTKEIAEKLNCDYYLYEGFSHAVYDEDPEHVKNMYRFFMLYI